MVVRARAVAVRPEMVRSVAFRGSVIGVRSSRLGKTVSWGGELERRFDDGGGEMVAVREAEEVSVGEVLLGISVGNDGGGLTQDVGHLQWLGDYAERKLPDALLIDIELKDRGHFLHRCIPVVVANMSMARNDRRTWQRREGGKSKHTVLMSVFLGKMTCSTRWPSLDLGTRFLSDFVVAKSSTTPRM